MDDSLLGLAEPDTPTSVKEVSSATLSGGLQEAGAAPEIVAAIAAAISTFLNIAASQLVISSLKPVPPQCNSSFWTMAGRQRLLEKRQDLTILRRRKN
ncbi:MAG: hypothetical protein KGZ54_10405 [Dethiobacter sp.]|jgi:hypothetical protein|nr:hypothetical protein [Dethiobacter sp.]MBS3989036.1 hypothetical protein [Dethiobacter sp.]